MYGERARAYYSNQIATNLDSETKAVFEFILPLFSKCYKSQGMIVYLFCIDFVIGQLKEIQVRVINHLRGMIQSEQATS